jgi:IclR family acetate operon transcriptional repressor
MAAERSAGRGYSRLLKLMEALAEKPEGISIKEAQARADIPRSSAWLLLRELEGEGIVVNRGGLFAIGPRLLRLGVSISQFVTGGNAQHELLAELCQSTGVDVYCAARVGNDIVYTDRIDGELAIHLNFPLGVPRPIHATAVGKLYLALEPDLWNKAVSGGDLIRYTDATIIDEKKLQDELQEIRERNYAVSRGERLLGIYSIAAPVFNDSGGLIAAVLLSAHQSAIEPRLSELAGQMAQACRELAAARAVAPTGQLVKD